MTKFSRKKSGKRDLEEALWAIDNIKIDLEVK